LLVAALLADPEVAEVRTVARRAMPEHRRLVHTRADLRSPEARRAVGGVDVLYHLGFRLWPVRRGRDPMEATNVAGTANVVAGARRVVLASSAAVYGAWPTNPLPLRESDPARPNPQCRYAVHKLAAERLCEQAAPTVSLRISAVLGPRADPAILSAALAYRWVVPEILGAGLALQFLSEEDAVAALTRAGRSSCTGVMNVASEDWLDGRAIAAISGGRIVALPDPVLVGGSAVAHRLGLLPFGPDRSVLLRGPMALAVERARAELGWRPTASSTEVLAAALRLGRPAGPAGLVGLVPRPR
jgi:UDP-glucose 4-epimerase